MLWLSEAGWVKVMSEPLLLMVVVSSMGELSSKTTPQLQNKIVSFSGGKQTNKPLAALKNSYVWGPDSSIFLSDIL